MSTDATLRDLWDRLDVWIRLNAPTLAGTLRPGATDEQIDQAEATLGVVFPDDIRASYRIHDGQATDDLGLVDGREFLSLERILDEWQVWKGLLDDGTFEDAQSEPDGPIRTDWWHPSWIPLTYDGSGNHDCLDLAPADGGHVGQVIRFWHDDPDRNVSAESFTAWLRELVVGCETGLYYFSEDDGGIILE